MNVCDHMLTSFTHLQNRSFHVVERTRTSTKCQKMKNARAKRAKILFFIVNYANLWGFCCRRRRQLNNERAFSGQSWAAESLSGLSMGLFLLHFVTYSSKTH